MEHRPCASAQLLSRVVLASSSSFLCAQFEMQNRLPKEKRCKIDNLASVHTFIWYSLSTKKTGWCPFIFPVWRCGQLKYQSQNLTAVHGYWLHCLLGLPLLGSYHVTRVLPLNAIESFLGRLEIIFRVMELWSILIMWFLIRSFFRPI